MTGTATVSHMAEGAFIKPIITQAKKQSLNCQHDRGLGYSDLAGLG